MNDDLRTARAILVSSIGCIVFWLLILAVAR